MSGASSSFIQIEQPVSATRQSLWQACCSPAGLARWQADDVSGEVQVGSHVLLRYPAFAAEVTLDVVDRVEQRRLVLQGDGSIVDLQFHDGGVSLTHTGPEVRADREGILSSWRLSLAQLAHSVESHAEQDRVVTWALCTVAASPELIHLCFTDAHCLAQWLGRGQVGNEGERYEIQNQEGLHLVGSVKVNVPGRDVALVCENLHNSMLIFRTLPAPNAKTDRIIALAWSTWGEQDPPWMLPTVEALETAIDDLQLFLKRTGRD